MTQLLLSIRPVFAEMILTGAKRFEFRRRLPANREATRVVMYASLPTGLVVGEFTVSHYLSDSPEQLWAQTHDGAGINKAYFDAYFSGRTLAHALAITEVVSYPEPKMLREVLASGIAPQSFCYLRS